MILIWILYAATALASTAFFVLYRDLLSLLLLVVVACIPVILFIIHLISASLTRISVTMDESVVSQSKSAALRVHIVNKSPFSITNITLRAICSNSFMRASHSCDFVVGAKPFSNADYIYEMTSEHVGNIRVKINRAVVYDFFGLFFFTKKIKLDRTVSFIPDAAPVELALRPNNFAAIEANVFSKTKPGDDPSEVFVVRDYVDSDRINRIHWKLTSKMGHYMVKDYSLPISESALLYIDLTATSGDERSLFLIDAIIRTAVSVSTVFSSRSVIHSIAWYDSRSRQFKLSKIDEPEDLYLTLGMLYESSICDDVPDVFYSELLRRTFFSHAIVISAQEINEVELQMISSNMRNILCSMLSVTDTKQTKEYADTGIPVYQVISNKISESLFNAML